MIPHNKPTLGRKEIKAVGGVMKSGWLVQGRKVLAFEDGICRYLGIGKSLAVAFSSGTASLLVALKVSGVKPKDCVLLPTYTCSAVLNAVYMAGAEPVLIDIDERDFNISLRGIKDKINKKSKAIIITHTFGVPFDVRKILGLGVSVIEDCATAIGSRIDGKLVGVFGDCSINSFYASKVITTGQGGMLVSRDKQKIDAAIDYRNFDYVKDYYPRFNLQMTDIQAAMGLVQLKRLPEFLKARREIAARYKDVCLLKGWDYQRPQDAQLSQNWFRFVVKHEAKIIGRLKKYLAKKGIGAIIPIEEWELLHNYLSLSKRNFPVAELVSKTTLSLPIYPGVLFSGATGRIVKVLKEF